MKVSEFRIGLDFFHGCGVPYRCTDVGRRTVTAIRLTKASGQWHIGPPYAVEESTFDELALNDCYTTSAQAITQAIEEHVRSSMPPYPSSAMGRFIDARRTPDYMAYPNKPLLRLNKVVGGDILHPYGAVRRGEFWKILCYLPFEDEYQELDEYFFLSLPMATEDDYRQSKAIKQ